MAMTDNIELTRQKVANLAKSADAGSITRIPTSRDLEAIVDRKFANKVNTYRWYAVAPPSGDIHAVADIGGQRISLQRLVMSLAHPEKNFEDLKHVSFKNKFSLDCRLQNLLEKVGRLSVMRNRRPKRNTSSLYKGVRKEEKKNGGAVWRGQITGPSGTMSLGTFKNEKWAARVYDAAAFLLFESTGYYNFPDEKPDPDALELALLKITRFHVRQSQKKKA